MVKEQGDDQALFMDPWVIFWQTYEDLKERTGAIKAAMNPLSPARTGEAVAFNSAGSRKGPIGSELSYRWLFGDGGWSDDPNPTHTYARVYPVTLIVSDGAETDSFTQHITVTGESLALPALTLEADEPTFRKRSAHVMDVYGQPLRLIPHTLYFTGRPTRPRPTPKVVTIKNTGGGTMPAAFISSIQYYRGSDWLELELTGSGDQQQLRVTCDAAGLHPGLYCAQVYLTCPGAVNETQGFDVQLLVPLQEPENKWLGNTPKQVVDDSDVSFYATPWFWVGCRVKTVFQGFRGFHLTSGHRTADDEFVRFTPDLPAGRHQVSLADETPFAEEAAFWVVVRHRDGDDRIWMEPCKSRIIGTFYFDEGTDGYVEIHTKDSRGEVLADAVVFFMLEQD